MNQLTYEIKDYLKDKGILYEKTLPFLPSFDQFLRDWRTSSQVIREFEIIPNATPDEERWEGHVEGEIVTVRFYLEDIAKVNSPNPLIRRMRFDGSRQAYEQIRREIQNISKEETESP